MTSITFNSIYTNSTNNYSSAEPLEEPHSSIDILDILGTVQKFDLDLYPLTWLPGLGPIGEGATAEVRQTLATITTDLAFKRTLGSVDRSFWALQSELIVLSQPAMKRHPNVLPLLGVCWDFPRDNEVRPVLIFERARFGNLTDFMESEQGQALDCDTRLSLCADVANAVITMHQSSNSPDDSGVEELTDEENNYRCYSWRPKARQHSSVR